MNLQQQRLEFLQNTINYYSEDVNRRAVVDNDDCIECRYLTEDGRKCAIGRFLDITLEQSDKLSNTPVESNRILNLLPNEVRDLGSPFLTDIQFLHDNNFFWNEEGLSHLGKKYVDTIIKDYCTT